MRGQRGPAALAGGQAGRPTTSRRRPSSPRRASAASASAGRRAAGAGPEPHVVGHGQVVVEAGRVAEQPDLTPHRPAIDGEVVPEHPGRAGLITGTRPAHTRSSVVLPAPFGPCSSTISPAATSRSTPARAGNRPRRETAPRKWTTGSMRTRPNGTGGPDRRDNAGPAVRRIRGGRPRTLPAPCSPVSSAPSDARSSPIGVLILLFVVYEIWGTNLQEASAQRDLTQGVQRAAGTGTPDDADTTPTAHVPTTGPTVDGAAARHRRSSRRRTCRCRTSATRSADDPHPEDRRQQDRRAGRHASTSSSGDPATTPRRRCRDRRATPASPATAPPTGRRSTTSTSWTIGDEIIVTTLQGTFRYKVDSKLIVAPTDVSVLAGQGRQPHHAHVVPSEVLGSPAHRRERRARGPAGASPHRPGPRRGDQRPAGGR